MHLTNLISAGTCALFAFIIEFKMQSMFNFKNCNVLNMMFSHQIHERIQNFFRRGGRFKGQLCLSGMGAGVKLSFANSNLPYKFNKLGISEGCKGRGGGGGADTPDLSTPV